jgi:hypothetical protein
MIEMAGEGRRRSRVDANNPSPDIGEEAPAYGSGQPTAKLRDLKSS